MDLRDALGQQEQSAQEQDQSRPENALLDRPEPRAW